MTPQRLAFNCCKFAAGLFVLAIVGAGILAIRLQQGPIEIDGLGDKIESALHDRFGKAVAFDLGRASMVQRGFGPSLAIDTLAVSGPDHQMILSAPRAEVSIDPFALMFGKVVPKRLEVMDVTLRLVLLKNGSLAVAAGDGTKPFLELGRGREGDGHPGDFVGTPRSSPVGTSPADEGALDPSTPTGHRAIVMKQAASAIRQFLDLLTDPQGTITAIDRFGITGGRLVIEDKMTNEEVVYSDLDLDFGNRHGVTNLTMSAKGPNGRWTVDAVAQRQGGVRRFGIKARGFTLDEIQLAAGTRSLGFDSDMPVAFTADLGLKPDNTLSEAAGTFQLGPGFVRFEDPDQEPSFFNDVSGAVHWSGEDRQIMVERLDYAERNGSAFKGAGTVKPPHDEGEPWQIALAMTRPGIVGPDRAGQHPIKVDTGDFKGRLFLARKMFMIDRFAVHGAEGGIALAGEFDWVKGPHIKLGASIDPTTVHFAKRVWPAFMAAPVRAWIVNHFEDGQLTSGTIRIDYDEAALKRMRSDRPPPDQSVSLDFKLSKGRLRYLDGVPPIDDVEGIGHITGRVSRFDFPTGTINANGRTVNVSDGRFLVPNTDQRPTTAVLTAHLGGDVEAVTDILSRDALKPYAALPLDASTLHGTIDGTLTKTLYLGPAGTTPDGPLRVDAKVSNFVADRLVGQEGLDDATLAINVDENRLTAKGQGRIFGGPATFDVERVGVEPPVAQISVTLDEAARSKLGLSALPGVTGPITAHVNTSLGDLSKINAQVDLDLGKASIAAAYLGLLKPAGRPAKVAFSVVPRDGRLSIDQLVVDIAALQARGSIELGPDNGFESAHFPSFKASPGDDMRLDVSKGDDAFKLTIRGSTIDARPFLKALTSTPVGDSTPLSRSAKAEKKNLEALKGFDIDLKTGILTGFNKEVMNAVELKLSKRGALYRQFAVHGRFGDDSISGSMGASQKLKITAEDAGALVSFIDLYKHMEGGALSAAMQVSDDTLAGNLEIRDFVLRDEPAIRSLVARSETVSPPGEGTEAARRINAGAVEFKRLKVSFERAGSRLELRDATMYGDEIGLSVDGWLDYVHDRVAMNGTFVPAYALNNMFAQIPVFGVFLGGKSSEGLLAITFRISGVASAPTLSINPLSAITPGFLRNIFGVLDTGSAPSPGFGAPSTDPTR